MAFPQNAIINKWHEIISEFTVHVLSNSNLLHISLFSINQINNCSEWIDDQMTFYMYTYVIKAYCFGKI